MKNFVCICFVTLCMVSCAPSFGYYGKLSRKEFRSLEQPKMDLYTLRSCGFGSNYMFCSYFYVDQRNGIYMHVDDRYHVEFGLCRTSQDTLYCYPRFYKAPKDSVFVRSDLSRLYAAFNEEGVWDDLDELVFLQTDDKLIYIGPRGPGPASASLVNAADGFVKVKIRNKRKYMRPILKIL